MTTTPIATINLLRATRESLNLTQQQMAARIGFSDVTLRGLEAGRLRPSPQLSALLETAFGVTVEQLLKPVQIVGELPVLRPLKKSGAR